MMARNRPRTLSSGDDTNSCMTKLFRRGIMEPIKKYQTGDDIEKHMEKVANYIKLAQILDTQEQIIILMDSFNDVEKKQIYMAYQFDENVKNFEWISKTIVTIFRKKESSTSPIAALLKTKQGRNENLEDFRTNFRCIAFDNISHYASDKKEKYLIKAFINGLVDRIAAKAVKMVEPKTLDEAFKLAKKQIKCNSSKTSEDLFAMRNYNNNNHEVSDLKRKVNELEKLVQTLQRQVSGMLSYKGKNQPGPPLPNQNFRGNPQISNMQGIKCYNCNKMGHIARDCRASFTCYKCGLADHVAANCPKTRFGNKPYPPKQFVKEMDDISGIISETESCTGSQVYEQCDQISDNKGWTVVTSKKLRSNPVNKRVQNHVAFINGNCERPKKGYWDNKPVIKLRLSSNNMKVLLDTGATCNVISSQMCSNMGMSDKIQPSNRIISCANNETMKIVGEVYLDVCLPHVLVREKFIVVDHDQMDIPILGIRSMKKAKISVNAHRNCIFANGVCIPFISEIHTPTTCAPKLN